MLSSFVSTHIGQRKINEDSYLVDEQLGLYVVADGVGGLDKGEVASRLACEVIHDSVKSGNSLKNSLMAAHNFLITEKKYNRSKQGMATTVAAVKFTGNQYEVAWVGDTRVYLWDENIKLLTKDDSYVELLIESGHLSLQEVETHPDRHIISQALGIERKKIEVHCNHGTLEKNQMLLICSDGLYDMVPEETIFSKIKRTKDLQKLTENLVQSAVNNDGKDNITLIAILSHENSENSDSVTQPNVVRHLNNVTGHMQNEEVLTEPMNELSNEDKQKPKKDKFAGVTVSDPQLINQTKYHDLSEKDMELLETLSKQAKKENSPTKSGNHIIAVVIVSAIALVSLLLFR